MKVVIDQSTLGAALKAVGRAISPKSPVDILRGVRIVARGDQVTLTGTNREIAMVFTLDADVQENGTIVIPHALFSEWVAGLTGKVTLEKSGTRLKVSDKRRESKMAPFADEYPVDPSLNGMAIAFQDNENALSPAIKEVAYAAATDVTRPVLCGIQISVANGKARMVGMDGYRLAIRSIQVDTDIDMEVVVPSSSMSEVSRAAELFEGPQISMYTKDEKVVAFVIKHKDAEKTGIRKLVVTCAVAADRYPKWEPFLGWLTNESVVVADANVLMREVRALAPFARECSNQFTMTSTATGVVFSVDKAESGPASVNIEAPTEGKAGQTVAVSVKFMLEALLPFGRRQVKLSFATNHPGARANLVSIVPSGTDDVEDSVAIIVPIASEAKPAQAQEPAPATKDEEEMYEEEEEGYQVGEEE